MRIEPGAEEQPMTVAELTELDRRAVQELGLPSLVLMEHAGRGAASAIHAWLEQRGVALDRTVVILSGPGNNGGDGFVVARWLTLLGRRAVVLACVARERLRGDAALEFAIADASGVELRTEPTLGELCAELASAGAAVDALLGTGSRGAPEGVLAGWIDALNLASARGLSVAALDLPSGLRAAAGDGGSMEGRSKSIGRHAVEGGTEAATRARDAWPIVRAGLTVSFAAPKAALMVEPGRSLAGEVVVVPIGVGRRILPPEGRAVRPVRLPEGA